MIKKLLIRNFQIHSKLKIEFDPRITTIIGSSDVGKSSVIRAIKWVCKNNPQGQAFIKDGTKGTSVKLFVDDKSITRKRTKSENTYFLDKNEFKAFGPNVPDTISKVLNILISFLSIRNSQIQTLRECVVLYNNSPVC